MLWLAGERLPIGIGAAFKTFERQQRRETSPVRLFAPLQPQQLLLSFLHLAQAAGASHMQL